MLSKFAHADGANITFTLNRPLRLLLGFRFRHCLNRHVFFRDSCDAHADPKLFGLRLNSLRRGWPLWLQLDSRCNARLRRRRARLFQLAAVAEFCPLVLYAMDQDTFTKLVQLLRHLHSDASDVAEVVVIPTLFVGAVFGLLLARWIFRGGLSRCAFRCGRPRLL